MSIMVVLIVANLCYQNHFEPACGRMISGFLLGHLFSLHDLFLVNLYPSSQELSSCPPPQGLEHFHFEHSRPTWQGKKSKPVINQALSYDPYGPARAFIAKLLRNPRMSAVRDGASRAGKP